MRVIVSFLMLLVALFFVSGCGSDVGNTENPNRTQDFSEINYIGPAARKVLIAFEHRSNVSRLGQSGLLVYLDKSNGQSISMLAAYRNEPMQNVRLAIWPGRIASAYTDYRNNSKLVQSYDWYTKYMATNGSLSPFGLIVFKSENELTVYAEQQNGTNNGVGFYDAYMNVTDGLFVKYSYYADSPQQHRQVNKVVRFWLKNIN